MYNKMFRIIKHEEVAPGYRLMCLEAPEIASRAAPGQFLHVRCSGGIDPILRRPLSIHFADPERGRVYVLYRVSGKGTALLAGKRPGEEVDVMGPLGRGYTIPAPGESAAVIAGGIGVAPLFFLLGEIKRVCCRDIVKVPVFLGAATSVVLPAAVRIRDMGFPLYIATDDGSSGYKGTVLDLFKSEAGGRVFLRVYACGPAPMLKSLAEAVGPGPEIEVSVEERMGCGVGACLSCACRVRSGGYAHVCKDGPVFNLRELIV